MPDPAGAMGAVRAWYPAVGSTMDIAMALAMAGAPHGTVVEAAWQSAGRGRQGRRWIAPPGAALLTSWILRPPPGRDPGVLSPLSALALIRAIEVLAPGVPVAWKWPNDVLIDGRKVAGILLTSRVAGPDTVAIAGIGVNVAQESMPAGEGGTALALWRPGLDPAALREALAAELARIWGAYLDHDRLGDADRAELERRMSWRGEPVEIRLPDGDLPCIPRGVAADGGLRVAIVAGGGERTLHVGEVVRGPRAARPAGPDICRILP